MNADPRNPSGTTIAGRYRVVRKLGAGGMGAVWLVEHNESLQLYALKTLHPRGAIERMTLERFLREARAAAALRSKHVVKVIDAQMNHMNDVTGEPMPFIVMELLEGMNLEQLLQKQGPLPPAQVVWILRQVARALDVAHPKGIVHRDLKPENLFIALDEDGEPVTKVCDFGIAKLNGALAQGLMTTGQLGTEGGVLLGTPLYMSPEQARNSTEVVAESDQWAMGLIAFKALTGQEYFGDALGTSELFIKIFVDPFVAPTAKDARLPAAFDAWFLKACARDATARFASVGEEIKALAEALGVGEGEPPRIDASIAKIVVERPGSGQVARTATVAPAGTPHPHFTPHTPHGTTPSGDAPSTITRSPTSKTHHPSAPQAASLATTTSHKRFGLVFSLAGALALVAVLVAVIVVRTSQTGVTPGGGGGEKTTVGTDGAKTKPKPEPEPEPVTGPESATESQSEAASVTATATATVTASAPIPVAVSATTKPKAKPYKPATTATTPPPPKSGKPKGASCTRSAECMSGFCVAEECQ